MNFQRFLRKSQSQIEKQIFFNHRSGGIFYPRNYKKRQILRSFKRSNGVNYKANYMHGLYFIERRTLGQKFVDFVIRSTVRHTNILAYMETIFPKRWIPQVQMLKRNKIRIIRRWPDLGLGNIFNPKSTRHGLDPSASTNSGYFGASYSKII